MPSPFYSHVQRLEHLFQLSNTLVDEEYIANWAKYLCILTSGLLENAVRAVIWRYSSKKASPQLQSYINKRMETITNLNYEKLSQLVNSFSREWADEFERRTSDEQRAAVDSVVALRNSIAHGRDVGISFRTMEDYFRRTKALLSVLEDIIDPERA